MFQHCSLLLYKILGPTLPLAIRSKLVNNMWKAKIVTSSMCSIPGSHKYYNVFIVQRRSIHSYLPAWWHIWNTDLNVCHGVRFYNRSSVYWKDGLICSYPLQAPPARLVLSVTKPVYREYMKCMHSHTNFLIIFLFYERIFPNTLPRTNRPRAVI